jgi:hypothetical protein
LCARARRLAAPLLLAGLLALSGCGGSGEATSAAVLNLRREDFLVACRALNSAAGRVAVEVGAARRTWRLIVDGLPRVITADTEQALASAAASAAGVMLPSPFQEPRGLSLTGPAADVAGLFRSYVLLSTRGWRLIAAAASEVEHGSPAAARFARENVALYIESVYDAHFTLAQIGKKLLAGYRQLGSASEFGAALPAAQVSALAATYSEASDRLHPHVGVRLGS